jgi:hypothetical protein
MIIVLVTPIDYVGMGRGKEQGTVRMNRSITEEFSQAKME